VRTTGREMQLTRQIGEHLLAAELGRRDYVATPFAGNTSRCTICWPPTLVGTVSRSRLKQLTGGVEAEVDDTFTTFLQKRAGALLIGTDAFFNGHAEPALAIRHLVPAICEIRRLVAAGNLISFGGRQYYSVYTGCILKDDKPAELPVQQVLQRSS
jgi:hypothetical protein